MSKRTANFTSSEEELLVQLVKKRKFVIECKKTDAVSSRDKELAWAALSKEYNIHFTTFRDAVTLRRKYENIKKRSKKKFAEAKCYLKGTGGGESQEISVTAVDAALQELLGDQITGMESQYDDDAALISVVNHIEPPIDENAEIVVENETEIIEQPQDWSKYCPTMLRTPRSIQLLPSSLQHTIFANEDLTVLNNENAESSTCIQVLPDTQDVEDAPVTPTMLKINSCKGTRRPTPTHLQTKKKKSADATWTAVGIAKMEVANLQKHVLQEERANQKKLWELKFQCTKEMHELTVDMLKKEHSLKLRILEAELEFKKSLINNNN